MVCAVFDEMRWWRQGTTWSSSVRARVGTRGYAGWDWVRGVDVDDKSRWAYEYEEAGRVKVGDRVEDFFSRLDCELCSVR